RLVGQVAKRGFLACIGGSRELLRGAAILAFLLCIFFGGGERFVVFGLGDDLVVHASDDFFHNSAAGIGRGFRLGGNRRGRGRRLDWFRFGRGRRWGFKFR